MLRHLAWFRLEDGQWLGEWKGHLPPPPAHLLAQVGDARTIGMNTWLQDAQRMITPSGSPYDVHEQCWDITAWEDCPDGGAVCVDVSRFGWPVGDHFHHRWSTIDAGIEYGEMRHYIQIDRSRKYIDANQSSSRFIRPTPEKALLDITGTVLEKFHGDITGELSDEDGRWVLTGAPAHVADGIQHALDGGAVGISGALLPYEEKVLTA
jgi:hypothetical protein